MAVYGVGFKYGGWNVQKDRFKRRRNLYRLAKRTPRYTHILS